MKHIKQFESYRVNRRRDELIKEAVLQVNDIYKVRVLADVPQSLLNAYTKKVKDNAGKNLKQFFGDMDLAETIVQWIVSNGLDVDKIPANALVGGAQGQTQMSGQGQAQTQGQGQAQAQTEDQPQAQVQTGFEDVQAQPQAQTQGQGQAQPQAQTQGQGQAQPQAQTQGQGQAQPQAQTQGQGQAQPQAQTQGQGQAQEEEEVPGEEEGEEELPA
jgi:hypothetical protein